MWVMLIGVAIVMFIMSRRNKKKQGDANAFRSDLAPGQRVMTVSGMVGVVSRVEGDIIVIASDAGDESQWVRRAIRSLVPDDEWEAMTSDYPDDPEEASPDTDDPESPDTDGPDDPDEKA
jgi:preprotein translocase subunit YajC